MCNGVAALHDAAAHDAGPLLVLFLGGMSPAAALSLTMLRCGQSNLLQYVPAAARNLSWTTGPDCSCIENDSSQ